MRDIIKYIWVAVILFSGFNSYAQLVDLKLVNDEDLSLFYSEMRNSKGTISYADIKGSPYYFDDFKSADIYFNNSLIKNVGIRLNLYNKTLEFLRDSEILVMTNMKDLDQVKTNGEHIIFVNEVDNPKDRGFYKIVVDGEYKLLQFLQVVYFDATKATSFYEDDKPAEFKFLKEKYYLRIENNDPIAFGNKKDFQESFAKSHPSLVEYAKKNKLNTKKYADLVSMVIFLNASNEKSVN